VLVPYADTIAAVRANLLDVFREMDRWFDRPAEVRAFRPASGGWTVDEVLEHVSLTNHYLMLTLRKSVETAVRRAARGEPIPPAESDLHRLQAIGVRGSFPWSRPEHMEPTGRVTSDAVRVTLRDQVAECLALLDRMNGGEGALCHLRMSVNHLGRVDLYQWLYFLAQHARRHLQQLAAIEQEFTATTPHA
jgi:hypothetical protein